MDFSETHPPPDILAKMQEDNEIKIVYKAGGGQPPPPGLEHEMVLNEALNIFIDRNAKRADAWRDAGYKGNLVEMRKKLDRLWAVWEGPIESKDIDEALDLINAAVFYIRCVRDGNTNGIWPWPK